MLQSVNCYERIILGGHSFHPAWQPESFLSESGFVKLMQQAYSGGLRKFEATLEAEVQVLGSLLRRWGPPPDISVGCLQIYDVTPTHQEQRQQLLRWLELLGLKALDRLYIYPHPNEAQASELIKQKQEGLFRTLGIWIRSPEDKVNPGLFDFVAGVYNPVRSELAGRLAECRPLGLKTMILEPLGGGALLANLPSEKKMHAAKELLRHSLNRSWCNAVIVTMRTANEVAANLDVVRSLSVNPQENIISKVEAMSYATAFTSWKGGWDGMTSAWDGRFGIIP